MIKQFVLVFMLLLATQMSYAVIETSNDHYFKLKTDVVIDAPIEKVNQHLLDIGEWWNPAHSYSGKKQNLYLDLETRLCFCEKMPDGGIVIHMQVANYQPPGLMRLVGGLGPLQTIPVNGVLDFNLRASAADKTHLSVIYQVSGSVPNLKQWPAAVDGVISEQVVRLKQFVEQP